MDIRFLTHFLRCRMCNHPHWDHGLCFRWFHCDQTRQRTRAAGAHNRFRVYGWYMCGGFLCGCGLDSGGSNGQEACRWRYVEWCYRGVSLITYQYYSPSRFSHMDTRVLAVTIASELAAARPDVFGPGTFLPALIDELYNLTPDKVVERAKVEVMD